MIPQTETNFDAPHKLSSEPKKNYDFLLTLTAIMFLSGGYAVWFFYNLPIETEAEEIAPIIREDKTLNWQTYRNEEYGFEFKYPKSQEVHVSGSSIRVGTAPWILTIETSNVGRESVFDSNSGVFLEEINFAGKKAKEYSCPDKNKCPSQLSKSKAIKLVDLPKNWKSSNEIFYDAYTQENAVLADKILSTLKFIP